jgi:hypothetical protein
MTAINIGSTYLTTDKEHFKLKVADRLKIGEEFITRDVKNEQEYKKCWDDFIDWNEYNEELIKMAFNHPDNSYADDYKRQTSSGGAVFPGTYKEPTFQEKVEGIRGEMGYQVRKLKWFYEKIDLLKSDPSLLAQKKSDRLQDLIHLLKRFHKIAQELRDRREGREPVFIKDEYDVQYLLGALLKLYFDDIRIEDASPSNSGSNSRLDFVLKQEKIIIETKMTNDNLRSNKLGGELLIDIGRYKSYPDCTDLVIFIYDKGDHIGNKKGFINDLEGHSTEQFKVTVIITPE